MIKSNPALSERPHGPRKHPTRGLAKVHEPEGESERHQESGRSATQNAGNRGKVARDRNHRGRGMGEKAAEQDEKKTNHKNSANLACVPTSPLVFRTSGARGHCSGAECVAFNQRDLEFHDHIADCETNAWLCECRETLEQFEDSLADESVSVRRQEAGTASHVRSLRTSSSFVRTEIRALPRTGCRDRET